MNTLPNKHMKPFTLYRLKDRPVFMMAIAKSGCTYLKHLFYLLDHGENYPSGNKIHKDQSALLKATEDDHETILRTPYKFIVVRDPIARFFSLYFDKIYGQGPNAMHWFRAKVGDDIGLRYERDLGLAGHQENALKLAAWLRLNLNGLTVIERDFHWRPQASRYNHVKGYNPEIVLLSELKPKLTGLLSPIIPDIDEKMDSIPRHNSSQKPCDVSELLSDELEASLRRTYHSDFKLVQNLSA